MRSLLGLEVWQLYKHPARHAQKILAELCVLQGPHMAQVLGKVQDAEGARLRGGVRVPERAVHQLAHVAQLPPHAALPLHLRAQQRAEAPAAEP